MNGTVLQKIEVAHGGSVTPPAGPAEADHTFKGWDHGDWLGCVTNDINVWALYEGTKTWAKGTNYGSESIVFRDEPYSLDEYFKMYDNLAWADEFSRSGTNDVNRDYWNYATHPLRPRRRCLSLCRSSRVFGKGLTGDAAAFSRETNGIKNGVRYAFDIDPATSDVGTPIIQVVRDVSGNPCVQARELAEGRSDVTFGVLATENLSDWNDAVLIPMEKFDSDSLWKPSASKNNSSYVFPAKMFFKYSVEIQ